MTATDDFFLPEDQRLGEQMRSTMARVLRTLTDMIEAELRDHAARLLGARGASEIAQALSADTDPVLPRLMQSGLLRDPELMSELIARVRAESIGNALPIQGVVDPDRPSLINRFVQHPDRLVASGAMAVLIAESRRRAGAERPHVAHAELPAELHHRMVWWVAATLRERVARGLDGPADALDLALADAAARSLSAYDEGDRLEAAAMRFAGAVEAPPAELAMMLREALDDRRIVPFIALLAHALGVDYALAREIVLDPAGDRLWLALRALELGREDIARIGFALCEADPRRDLEEFADLLDAIASVGSTEARAALAPMRLHPDYRAAVQALGRSGRGA
jgi:hypothetical protein